MKCLLFLFLIGLPGVPAAFAADNWSRSIVEIEASRKVYNLGQPWIRTLSRSRGQAVVLEGRKLLTTAQGLQDLTLARVRRDGGGKWWAANPTWIDYHANLALLEVHSEDFWKGLTPVRFASEPPMTGQMRIRRWNNRLLESWPAEVQRYVVSSSVMSHAQYRYLEVTSQIDQTGDSDILSYKDRFAGFAVRRFGNRQQSIPASFIKRVIEATRKKDFPGLGYFHFSWQHGENPQTVRYLSGGKAEKGIIVTEVPPLPGRESGLHPMDLVVAVDGHEIEVNGDYQAGRPGFLSFQDLATHKKWAGETVELTVLRKKEQLKLDYVLPEVSFEHQLVPEAVWDRPPEYFIAGGLIFQPLTKPLLNHVEAQGGDNSFRLGYYAGQPPTEDRKRLFVLTQVLPHPMNLGYQDARNLVLHSINGHRIAALSDIPEALEQSKDGFHVLEFEPGLSLQSLVLSAQGLEVATGEILQRYGIPAAAVMHGTAASQN